MTRTRSEYRLADLPATPIVRLPASARPVVIGDRVELAALLLDAYRGTVDDEGENDEDALAAIDHYLSIIEWRHSFVLAFDGELQAASFVVALDGRHYIDPVVTRAAVKRSGLGTAAVCTSLRSLAAAGAREAGATITDGNVASERLFTRLGFVRVGAW